MITKYTIEPDESQRAKRRLLNYRELGSVAESGKLADSSKLAECSKVEMTCARDSTSSHREESQPSKNGAVAAAEAVPCLNLAAFDKSRLPDHIPARNKNRRIRVKQQTGTISSYRDAW